MEYKFSSSITASEPSHIRPIQTRDLLTRLGAEEKGLSTNQYGGGEIITNLSYIIIDMTYLIGTLSYIAPSKS